MPGTRSPRVLSRAAATSAAQRTPTQRVSIELAINLGTSTLHTDSATHYRRIAATTKGHESVNHNQGEYVRDGVSTNMAEGFFSQLKRSIDGTHHHVSKKHLPRYLTQFDFLYSTRELTDSERMRKLLGQVSGRRLTYRPLTGHTNGRSAVRERGRWFGRFRGQVSMYSR